MRQKQAASVSMLEKENHHHTMKQEQINELLAQKALQYDIVVRLKGGDPFVFGRGGEEAIYLAESWKFTAKSFQESAPVFAAAELAGIPVTHQRNLQRIPRCDST